MRFQGAVIREQGVTFAIVVVKKTVIDFTSKTQEAMQAFSGIFQGLPVVLVAQDSKGVPTWFGRKDIVRFLANVPLYAIPWKKFTYQ